MNKKVVAVIVVVSIILIIAGYFVWKKKNEPTTLGVAPPNVQGGLPPVIGSTLYEGTGVHTLQV